MVATTVHKANVRFSSDFELSKTKFQTKINLSRRIFARFQIIQCLRASYEWYLSIADVSSGIRPQYLRTFILCFFCTKKTRYRDAWELRL